MDFIGRSDPFAILFLDPTGSISSRRASESQSALSDKRLPSLSDALSSPATRSLRPGRYPGRDSRWDRVGKTETVPNSLECTFATSFEIPYFFERAQKLAVDVFDRDVASESDQHIHRHDYLGSAEAPVPALVRAPGQKLKIPLSVPDKPNQKCGYVTFIAEYVTESKLRLNYDVFISAFPSRLSFSKGKGPYLTVSRAPEGSVSASKSAAFSVSASATYPGSASSTPLQLRPPNSDSWITVMRTTKIGAPKGKGDYELPRLTYNYERFCRCDDDLPLRFDISFEKRGKHRVVASAVSTLRQCDSNGGVIELKTSHTGCFQGNDAGGRLLLKNRVVTEDNTFLDYIIGGCEISLVIAIDFTASNGDPKQNGTLHFWNPSEPNEYEMAIRAVGDILAAYDTDQLFPAYGFGAKLPPEFAHASHKFTLTSSPDPVCHTIDQVLNMYRETLYNVRLSGPTVFSEIVEAAAEHANREVTQNDQSYTILLIVTDGVISDVDNTLQEIAKATSLPLSIVIIGVGEADFSNMELLDGDDLDRERDIVQFVKFRQYRTTPEVLRAMVLEEIPGQLVQYMKQRGIEPHRQPDD